jgi:hypothetical protein
MMRLTATAQMLHLRPAQPTGENASMAVYQPDEMLTEQQAAEVLGLKPNTLRKYREKRTGPPYYRHGAGQRTRVRYKYSDLLAWRESRRVEPEKVRNA